MVRGSIGLIVLAVLGTSIGGARAMTLSGGDANIVELLQQSNDIVVGRVDSVTDGIDDRGIPYTEVTLEVSEAIRGSHLGDYKFRQFGLLAPRLTRGRQAEDDAGAAGFPKYSPGEDVALFLRPRAAWTGFRMPAGVTQGKFTIAAGRVENAMGNAGLFSNVRLDQSLTDRARQAAVDDRQRPHQSRRVPLASCGAPSGSAGSRPSVMTRTDRHDGSRIPPSDPDRRQRSDAGGSRRSRRRTPRRCCSDPNACVPLPRSGR